MKFSSWVGVLALSIVGCSEGEGPSVNGQADLASECRAPCKAPQLGKRAFLLESAEGFAALAGTTVRLSFHDGNLSVSAGCNSSSGLFSLEDGRLMHEGGTTEIGCDAARHAQDEWLWAFVQSRPRLELEGNTLTLTGASATLVFLDREVADPDRPLVGTPWTIDTFISNGGAGNFPGPVEPTLLFEADGDLQVNTSCNRGEAKYTVVGDQLTFAMVGVTERFCGGASGAAEAHILRVLNGDGPISFEIEAGRLTLMRGEVGISAIAP